jgi:hypothetical protein
VLGEDGHVVGVVADLQRAGLAEPGRQAGRLGQLGHEPRIAPQRRAAEVEELTLGVRGLCQGERRPLRAMRPGRIGSASATAIPRCAAPAMVGR